MFIVYFINKLHINYILSNMFKLSNMSDFIRTDVTSVKLYKNVILTGIGSFLRIYDRQSRKLIQKIRALNGQKIYGITPSKCELKLLIFGGKQFTVVKQSEYMFSCEIEPVICDDWIHSGIWLLNQKIALLNAHNVVKIWDIKTKSLLSQHISKDNSILYSGLLLQLNNDILIFSGTVFSQVILQWCGDNKPLHYLRGHKGVIFSITCKPEKGIIVTTSDDRSVRIWTVESLHLDYNSKTYWEKAEICCIHELYGHTARVMRNCLTNNYIISVGEDSLINFWDYDGKLLRKSISHQNASIWCLDADENQLVTGGGDCGVTLHPLSLVTDYSHNQIIDIDVIPKKVMFTARRNIIITKDDSNLTYFDINFKKIEEFHLNHTSKCQLVCLSSCKQIVAAVDMNGKLDIFIENCKGVPEFKKVIDTQLNIGKILSLQWAGNRHLVLCSEGGFITIMASKDINTEIVGNFILPPCKERWLTSSAFSDNKEILVVGDRCGNIHVYRRGNKNPQITFKRVHGRYGATTIGIRNNVVTTTGRDGTIKYFSISNTYEVKYMSCKDLEFQWVGKFLDGNYICGFRERTFVVYDIANNVKMLDVACGGGHRSWDAVRYFAKNNGNFEEFIRLMYLKNSNIHINTFCLNKIVSKNVIHGTHSKEINCLKTYTSDLDKSVTWYISGGEDTTLRISRSSVDLEFKDELIFKQLSNVRSLRILSLDDKRVLVVSAGGRAQICARVMTFKAENDNQINVFSEEVINYLIKGTDRERKGNQNWRNCSVDFDPETRIMDIEVISLTNNVFLFAACSDAILRIFNLHPRDGDFKMLKEINHHKTCILKTQKFKFLNKEILVTCTTRGEVAFWEIHQNIEMFENEPIFNIKANKSGINSVNIKIISNTLFLLATGGDDNAIHLNIIEAQNNIKSLKVVHSLVADKFHSSQITGLSLVDNLCVTTSVDQRVTSFSWELTEDGINICFVDQKHSDIADIHGMEIVDSLGDFITVCVYGKGMEVMKIPKA